jgi:hypothetical protein
MDYIIPGGRVFYEPYGGELYEIGNCIKSRLIVNPVMAEITIHGPLPEGTSDGEIINAKMSIAPFANGGNSHQRRVFRRKNTVKLVTDVRIVMTPN